MPQNKSGTTYLYDRWVAREKELLEKSFRSLLRNKETTDPPTLRSCHLSDICMAHHHASHTTVDPSECNFDEHGIALDAPLLVSDYQEMKGSHRSSPKLSSDCYVSTNTR